MARVDAGSDVDRYGNSVAREGTAGLVWRTVLALWSGVMHCSGVWTNA